jgi:hypothetical protein
VIVGERWYSQELQTAVMTKRSGPRSGETTFQLTNIQRQEPAATMFQVPSDHTVTQGPRHGEVRGARQYHRQNRKRSAAEADDFFYRAIIGGKPLRHTLLAAAPRRRKLSSLLIGNGLRRASQRSRRSP